MLVHSQKNLSNGDKLGMRLYGSIFSFFFKGILNHGRRYHKRTSSPLDTSGERRPSRRLLGLTQSCGRFLGLLLLHHDFKSVTAPIGVRDESTSKHATCTEIAKTTTGTASWHRKVPWNVARLMTPAAQRRHSGNQYQYSAVLHPWLICKPIKRSTIMQCESRHRFLVLDSIS